MLSFYRDSDFEVAAAYSTPALVSDNMEQIGSFAIQGVKPSFENESQKVKVKVRVDDNGCLQVPEATLVEKLPPQPEAEVSAEAAKPASGEEGNAMDTVRD